MKKTPERKHLFSFDQNVGFNKKYTTIAIYAMIILIFGVVCVYFLINNDKYANVFESLKGIFFPIFTGMVIAYILNPVMKLFEEHVFISAARRRLNRARRKLFHNKLSYDQLRLKNDEKDTAVDKARETLEATQKELAAAYAAVRDEEEKHTAKQLEKASKKKTKPTYRREPAPMKKPSSRGISLLCTYLIFLAVVTLLLWIVIPQCVDSIAALIVKLRALVNTLPADIENLVAQNEWIQTAYRYINDILFSEVDLKAELMNLVKSALSGVSSYLTGVVTTLPAYVMSAFSSITNIILALFFSVYFLLYKELLGHQAHRVGKAFLPRKTYKGACHIINEIDRKFGKFIEGKILDSTILGIVSLIVLWLFKMPYYQMLALIIGVTNFIPFFGPIIGGVIGGAILLISDPSKLLPFIIIVLIMQQIEGNLIEPMVLGDSLGLQPVWIMIAIVIMSSLFGFFGMIFGVPIFAVIYTLISESIEKRLKAKASAKPQVPDAPSDNPTAE